MSLRKQASAGLVWTFAQQFGNQIVSFVISLVLARLLLPAEFGLIGMIAIFYTIGKSLMNSGLTQSLIRSKELDQEDYSTVFYFNLIASFLIYVILFFAAPFIAAFYDQEILTDIVRVYCLTFIIDAFSSVQSTRLTKMMNFKTQTLITIPSILIGGIVGVSMAYVGYGVWSLVWSTVITSIASSIQLWIYAKWSPSWVFNMEKFKDHLNFGYKLTLSSLLDKIFANIYLIVIGRYFSVAQVGFYTRAETMKQLPVNNLANALNKVTFPLFANIQHDNIRLKRVYKQLMQMVVFIIAPILTILAVLAEPTFRFLFTEKWLPAVPYFQILCVTGILYPIHMYNLNILKIKGRTDLVLKLQVIKKIMIIIVITITIQFGIYGLLFGQVVLSFSSFFVNAFYTGKFINYNTWQQTRDIIPILLLSSTMGVIVYFSDFYLHNQIDIIRMIIPGIIGVLSFLSLSYLFKFDSLNKIKELIWKKH